ncbi:MAG: Zn-dependent hydrolase [Vicinamibacterales bacterium]
MDRRRFLTTLGAAALPIRGLGAARRDRQLRVDGARLRSQIERLSEFGRPPGGAFADGVSRIAYTDADVNARAYVMSLMREAGLFPYVDPAGNIFASVSRTRDSIVRGSDRPILFGSHIDSVPSGGNFDGDLGSLAAIEAVRTLHAAGVRTRHPLEVVVWAEEEGSAYGRSLSGSRAVAGEFPWSELDLVVNGVSKADAIRRIGGDPLRLEQARRKPEDFHAYLELHIEQGGTLERARLPIGVVEGIVSIERYDVTVRGFANHAGTTPMGERQDALVAASQLILAIREIVTREPGRQVGTVGKLEVSPNATNVVPGVVTHTIDLRDLDGAKLGRLAEEIRGRAREIAAATRTEIAITRVTHHDAALAAPAMQDAVARAADTLGLRWTGMPSGAGHDAQMAARLCPMGMIFVPSAGGISHSPRELTAWDDCTRGADVLLQTVLVVDQMARPLL